MLLQRVHTPGQVVCLAEKWRAEGRRIAFTNGCFDLFHTGHRYLLDEALHRGDRLIVAVNCDAYVRRHKGGGRPVQSGEVRAWNVALMSGAEAVLVFEEETPEALLAAIRPDVYLLGSDYRGGRVPGGWHCRRVEFVERLPGFSTTGIIARLGM